MCEAGVLACVLPLCKTSTCCAASQLRPLPFRSTKQRGTLECHLNPPRWCGLMMDYLCTFCLITCATRIDTPARSPSTNAKFQPERAASAMRNAGAAAEPACHVPVLPTRTDTNATANTLPIDRSQSALPSHWVLQLLSSTCQTCDAPMWDNTSLLLREVRTPGDHRHMCGKKYMHARQDGASCTPDKGLTATQQTNCTHG